MRSYGIQVRDTAPVVVRSLVGASWLCFSVTFAMYSRLAAIAGLALTFCAEAMAQDLNADETQSVLAAGPWRVEAGATGNYFLWNTDGTLCVKMYDPHAESCDDSGTWTRDGTEVCYQLQWWGKAYDQHEGCFRIANAERGGYATIDAAGLPELTFSIVASD